MSLNLAMLIRVDICRQTDELFERLHNKPFWIWNTEQHKFEDKYLINTGKLLGVVLDKSRATLV
jgi:hypothetical protein